MPVAGAEQIESGTVIGSRFQVESLLGQGALGRVSRAVDQKTQRPVALRFLSEGICQDAVVLERLRKQIQIASKLQHKNIIRVFGLGKEGDLHYVVMEHVEGQSLRNLLDKKKASHNTFSLKGAYNVVAHLCNALHHAHSSLVHGLPGPRSILVNTVGRVKLGEFGIYNSLAANTEELSHLGDLYCMAPEMMADPAAATPAADVFSVGVLLFELLTGQPPAPGSTVPSQIVSDLGSEVDEVVGRALQPNPADRYSDIRQLKAAFYAAISGSIDAPLSALPAGSGNGEDGASWVESPTPPPVPVEGPALAARPPAATPPAAAPPAVAGPAAPAPAAPGTGGNPFLIAPTAGAPGAPAAVASNSAQRQISMEELLADSGGDETERWLVQKDRLDFGPFSLGELKQQLYTREFTPNEMVLNKETGDVVRIRNHPDLREFIIHLESHFAHKEADQMEVQRLDKEKRSRTFTLLAVALALIILGACGAVAAWFLTKDPEIEERIVYREKEANIEKLLSGVEITWKKEQIKKKRKHRRKRPRRKTAAGKAEGEGSDVTYLGDATKEGGDERLAQSVVERVMQKNFRKLVPCFHAALRANPSLREVNIDFNIKGSGNVSFAKVNGKSSGALQICILGKMKSVKFPSFDGAMTPASFSLSLK